MNKKLDKKAVCVQIGKRLGSSKRLRAKLNPDYVGKDIFLNQIAILEALRYLLSQS
jgi:hypothetical protein